MPYKVQDGNTFRDMTAAETAQRVIDLEQGAIEMAAYNALEWKRNREGQYPSWREFAEAYCEKEIGEDSTKWDAYIIKYNLSRNNNPKP